MQSAPLGGVVAPCGFEAEDRSGETEESLPVNPASVSKFCHDSILVECNTIVTQTLTAEQQNRT